MAGPTFFGKSWLGRELEFTWPQPSSWKITTKFSEKFAQLTLRNLETVGGPKFSYAYGVFLCQNTSNAREEAFLKVYKQIPHLGTEGEPYTIRKEQAGTRTHHDIEAYKWFAEKQAKHLPICLAHKMGFQGDYGFVPDGYIHYVVYNKLPGLRLDERRFWSLEIFERDAVRNAFLPAYNELYSLGLDPGFHGLENLVWHRETNSVYIVGFTIAHSMTPDDAWKFTVLAEWGLTIPPKDEMWWVKGYVPLNMAKWKFWAWLYVWKHTCSS